MTGKRSTDRNTPPCADCGSRTRARSACQECGKVVCQLCAEREGEFCCEVAEGEQRVATTPGECENWPTRTKRTTATARPPPASHSSGRNGRRRS